MSIRPSTKDRLRLTDHLGRDPAGHPIPCPLILPGVNTWGHPLFDPESPSPLAPGLDGDADYRLYSPEIRGIPR